MLIILNIVVVTTLNVAIIDFILYLVAIIYVCVALGLPQNNTKAKSVVCGNLNTAPIPNAINGNNNNFSIFTTTSPRNSFKILTICKWNAHVSPKLNKATGDAARPIKPANSSTLCGRGT